MAASDRRLKKNIREFEDGLDVLMQIRPVWFQYNGKANMPLGKFYAGIIAQEMQKIAPYTVSSFDYHDENGSKETYLKYDGNATTYILIKSVQEQQAIIDAQLGRIASLEESMGAMKKSLEALVAGSESAKGSNQLAKQ